MKNKMADVRDHLVAMMEALSDIDVDEGVIERAKTTALLADKFIAAAKCEVDARRIAHEIGTLPLVFEAAPPAALGARETRVA